MADNVQGKKLRLITYLSPGVPLGLYQVYQYYLEEVLGMDSYLMVESRISGPAPGKLDPFSADEVDIGFLCSTLFLHLVNEGVSAAELLPVAPIHAHPRSEARPVYFSDVIILANKGEQYKEFKDLKGHKWAYNEPNSLSGNISTLIELKKSGTNASFFGHIIQSGGHRKSIEMVLNSTVDAAAIDSVVLKSYLTEHPEAKNKIKTLCSWGPWPIPPIVVNRRLPASIREKIINALLNMNKIPEWQQRLQEYQVWGFKPVTMEHYEREKAVREIIKGQSLETVYY